VSLDQAQAALSVLAARLRQQYPDDARGIRFKVVPETRARPHIALSGPLPMVAAAFMVLVSLVLLIACANVTSLILARAAGRRSELAVRTALGATRLRLIRQILTETLVVAFAGLLLGGALAWGVVRWLTSIRITADVQVRFDLHPDWRVYAYAGVAALVAALVSGLAPALHSSRVSLSEVLKEGTRAGGSLVRQRFRTSLVVVQVAVSLVLLVCAGLLTRSVLRATSLDLGFRTDHLLMATTDVRLQRYDRTRGERFYQELLTRASAIPGVRGAALTGQIPLGTDFGTTDLYADVPTLAAKEGHTTLLYTRITPRYFETMGIPLVAGRDFTTRDDTTTAGVAIINQTLAKMLWPNAEPLGKRFRLETKGPELEVVGVARDAKYRFLSDGAQPYLYVPLAQRYRSEMSVMLHTAVDPASIAAPLRAVYASLDKDLAVYEVKTMSSHLHDGIAFLFTRLAAMLATGLGLLGLIQAVVGLYGVVSYSVAQRTREIGIRMAIGADSGTVLRQVLGQGLAMTAVGVGLGLVLALAVSRLLGSMLVGVTAVDVATYAAAAAVLFTCALVAALVPAHRASRLQPSEALRAAE
jgi:predicted permease